MFLVLTLNYYFYTKFVFFNYNGCVIFSFCALTDHVSEYKVVFLPEWVLGLLDYWFLSQGLLGSLEYSMLMNPHFLSSLYLLYATVYRYKLSWFLFFPNRVFCKCVLHVHVFPVFSRCVPPVYLILKWKRLENNVFHIVVF